MNHAYDMSNRCVITSDDQEATPYELWYLVTRCSTISCLSSLSVT